MVQGSIRGSKEVSIGDLQSPEMQALQKQLDDLQKKQKELQDKIKDNNVKLDKLDDQKADLDDEIVAFKKEIVKEDAFADRMYLNSLNSLKIERDKVQKDTDGERSDLDKNEKEKLLVDRQLKECQEKLANLQQSVIKAQARQEAKQKAGQAVNRSLQDVERSDLGVMFLNAMVFDAKLAYRAISAYRQGESEASNRLNGDIHQQSEEKNLALKESAAGTGDNKAFIFMSNSNGQNKVHIFSADQLVRFKASAEYKDLVEAVAKEHDVPVIDRKVSVLITESDDRQALLQNLEPLMHRAVNHPEHISDFASSPSKQDKLITSILDNSMVVKNEEVGGHFFDRYTQVNLSNGQKQAVSEDKIPWHELKKLNVSKQELSPESIENLRNGRLSNMMEFKDASNQANSFNYKLSLDVDRITNQLHFSMVREVKSPNYEGLSKYSSYQLKPEDKQDLEQFGRMSRTIPFTDPLTGKQSQRLLCLDKETNRLLLKDPDKLSFNNVINYSTTVDEVRKFKSGMPIHASFTDNQGQRFNGWAVLDPTQQGNTRFLKEKPAFHNVDDQFKVQVANNNDGQRAESLRDDRDAVVLSGQTRDNDGSFGEPQTREQLAERDGRKSVFLNFSETDAESIERKTTVSPKL